METYYPFHSMCSDDTTSRGTPNPQGFCLPQKNGSGMTEEEFQRVVSIFRLLSKWDLRRSESEKEHPPSTGTEDAKESKGQNISGSRGDLENSITFEPSNCSVLFLI